MLEQEQGQDLHWEKFKSTNRREMPRVVEDVWFNDVEWGRYLKLPEVVKGSIHLTCLRAMEGAMLPEEVQKDLDLVNLRTTKDLRLPRRVGRNLALWSLEEVEEELVLPEEVGGNLDLLQLRSVGRVSWPEHVGGRVNLEGLQSWVGLKILPGWEGPVILGNGMRKERADELWQLVAGIKTRAKRRRWCTQGFSLADIDWFEEQLQEPVWREEQKGALLANNSREAVAKVRLFS
jgi:hypothetical protein